MRCLPASSCYRWLACPPSAKECAKLPDTSSEFARQRTPIRYASSRSRRHWDRSWKIRRNPSYFDEKWRNALTNTRSSSWNAWLQLKHPGCPLIMIEQRLDFSKWVPGGFGTGDCLIVADDTLTVIDYKHGLGVLVDAEKNPQMMCYATGP